jgi:hypothetical protein
MNLIDRRGTQLARCPAQAYATGSQDTNRRMTRQSSNDDQVDSLEGRYANFLAVGHNAFEFVLDFGQSYSSDLQRHTYTRVITAPSYAKAFLETLASSLNRYETEFGLIESAQAEIADSESTDHP